MFEKWCSSVLITGPTFLGLKHLGTENSFRECSFPLYFVHLLLITSGMGSSHPPSSCRMSFPSRMTGAMRPRGSKIELALDSIPLLVQGLSFKVMRKEKESFLMHHWTPSARSTGSRSLFRLTFLISLALSSDGMA